MKDEILPRMGILILYQLQGLGEPCLVGEVGTVRHPERIACHLAPDVDDGTSHGNLYLFDFVEYEQAQLLVKSVEHHHFPEGCLGLELVLRLRRIQKRIHVRRKAIIANVLQIVFSLLVIMDG